jgi:hypothetical protein
MDQTGVLSYVEWVTAVTILPTDEQFFPRRALVFQGFAEENLGEVTCLFEKLLF